MITVRQPSEIYQATGEIENGTFRGRWHFSFDQYDDPANTQFGTLRVFNDDTLSPGAIWPLHPHREIEVVTYCAAGEFRHADERGIGGVLKQGWAQHTTVGNGMFHSEINHRSDLPMRFIQLWFFPSQRGLTPSIEQKPVMRSERTNRWLALVSKEQPNALPIRSEAEVYSSFLQTGQSIDLTLKPNWGGYLYLVEGSTIRLNEQAVPTLGAAKIIGEKVITVRAEKDAELLLVHVSLA